MLFAIFLNYSIPVKAGWRLTGIDEMSVSISLEKRITLSPLEDKSFEAFFHV